MIRKDYYKLPKAYQEVEYIESTGTQWIDTGVLGEAYAIIDCQGTEITTSSQIVLGTYTSSPSYFAQYSNTGKWGISSQVYGALTDIDYTTRAKFEINFSKTNAYIKVNGTTYTYDAPQVFVDTETFALFRAKGRAATNYYYANARIYSVSFIQNGTLIRNMIPCYRKSDNVIGMYDIVNNTFYTNAGTGTFNKGNNVYHNQKEVDFVYKSILPSEYQQVEYIQSNGNQYLNLGFMASSNTNFELKLATTEENPSVIRRIFGGYNNASARYELALLNATSSGRIFINYYDFSYYTGYAPTVNVPFVISKKVTSLISPSETTTLPSDTFNGDRNAYLFASNRESTNKFIGRIYYMKIYTGSTLTKYLVPCYRKADNVAGMYDIKTGTFYTNQGTGAFVVGNSYAGSIDKVYYGEDLVFEQGYIREQTGTLPLTTEYQATGRNLLQYQIYGNTIQNGTPTPTSPVAIESVGDLVTDSSDPNYGKYKIPVTVSDGGFTTTVNIYLTKPLRRINDRDITIYADYIDFNEGKVYRVIGEYIFDSTHYSFNTTVVNNIRYFYRVISDVAFPVTAPFVTHYNGVRSFYQTISSLQATVNGGAYRSLYVRNDNYTTTTDFNAHIKSFADGGNPMTMYYVLPASLRRTENVTLPDLPTFKGTTTFTLDSSVNGSSMFIKYKGK